MVHQRRNPKRCHPIAGIWTVPSERRGRQEDETEGWSPTPEWQPSRGCGGWWRKGRGWGRGISHPIWYKAHKLAPKWSSKYSLVYIRYHIFRDS
jgi:hypothetical protein